MRRLRVAQPALWRQSQHPEAAIDTTSNGFSSAHLGLGAHDESACDLLNAPIHRVVVNESIGCFENFDREARSLGKDTELPVDDNHPVWPFDDILDFEPQVRKTVDGAAIEFANRRLAIYPAV